MRARRYLYERDATVEDLASVSVKARRHGARNPYAQFRSEVTIEQVLQSRPISEPLTLMQCCPMGDGAACVIVASDAMRRKLKRSEEHTSELQSLMRHSSAVFSLKKKK